MTKGTGIQKAVAQLLHAGADGRIEHQTSLLGTPEHTVADLAVQILIGTGRIAAAEPDVDLRRRLCGCTWLDYVLLSSDRLREGEGGLTKA